MRYNEVDAYLSQIIKFDHLIRNKRERYLELYTEARSLGGISDGVRVQTSGNVSGKVSDIVCQYVDLDREIRDLEARREAIIKVVESLPADEYYIIHQVFVKGKLLKQVCAEAGRSREWGRDVKRRALERIASILSHTAGGGDG